MENEQQKNYKPIILIIGIILVIAFMLYARFGATYGFIVKEYKITNDKITNTFHGLKIVHISDLHFGGSVDINKIDSIVDKINYIDPDLVLFSGDLIDRNHSLTKPEAEAIIKALRNINPNLGNYAITGSHDLQNKEYKYIINQSNFNLIDDNIEVIYNNNNDPILLTGLSTTRKNSNIDLKLEKTNSFLEENDNFFHILLVHEPDVIKQVDLNKFDVVFAGHSLNGQFRLPIIGPIILPEGAKDYYENKYIVNNTPVYISSGVGTTRVNIRLFNRPSINFYRLTNK